MSKTATHKTEDQDAMFDLVSSLGKLELSELSFIQLRRLHKILTQASAEVAAESDKRSANDKLGDTVRITSPKL